MPHMTAIFLSFSSSFKTLPKRLPRLPPSCRAAPSRPAEPPPNWVRMVLTKINGPVVGVIFSLEEMASMTMLVPLFPSSLKVRYSQTIRRPETGRRKMDQLWRSKKLEARLMPWPNTAPASPAAEPMTQAMAVHFKKYCRFAPTGVLAV